MSGDEKPKYFWIFDQNRRIYRRDARGKSYGEPIWIHHWREVAVTGETRVSWILGTGTPAWGGMKIPKRGPWPRPGICRSASEVEALAWAEGVKIEIRRRMDLIRGADLPEVVRLANALGIVVPLTAQHFAKEISR